jgi:hypothetical protein
MVLLVGAGLLLLFRVVSQWREALRPKDDNDDWDARFITQMRKAGVSPFDDHQVDFFFGLPNEAACQAVSAELEPEGFVVDYKADAHGGGWSLHASRGMRVRVPEMQALTKRFNALAATHGGRYDNWAVGKGLPRRTQV